MGKASVVRARRVEPLLPAGVRDWFGRRLAVRRWFVSQLETLFRSCGYVPLETPALERLEVLLAKYGEEASKLIFRILHSGDFTEHVDEGAWLAKDWRRLANQIADKGLRYDLTVPLARFVARHYHELAFPFRRYQIQPVWRAERPQRGRFREFLQCDFDILGTESEEADAEVLWILEEGFQRLGLSDFEIVVNDRRLLEDLLSRCGLSSLFQTVCTVLDKVDKVGVRVVREELERLSISSEARDALFRYLEVGHLEELRGSGLVGEASVESFMALLELARSLGVEHIRWDPFLVRGLDYYTGMVCEVRLVGRGVGSVAGGGRYDRLTETFSEWNVPGVGASFGIDRLVDAVVDEVEVPDEWQVHAGVVVFDRELFSEVWREVSGWRRAYLGLRVEVLPPMRLKKALRVLDKKGIPFAILCGSEELSGGRWTVRDMRTGEQVVLSPEAIPEYLLKTLKGRKA